MAFIGISTGYQLYGWEGFSGLTVIRSIWTEQCVPIGNWGNIAVAVDNWNEKSVASSDWIKKDRDIGVINRCD